MSAALKIRFPEDRGVPKNTELEKSTLGAMILDNETIPDITAILKATDFYRDEHQVIYRVIRDFSARGEPIDMPLLKAELERRGEFDKIGGIETLADISQAAPHSANALYHAKIVLSKSKLRSLIAAANETLNDAYRSMTEDTAETIVARAEGRFLGLDLGGFSLEPTLAADYFPRAIDRILARAEGKIFGVQTPWTQLNYLLGGCLHNGSMTVVAGRPGAGKSAFGVNLCEHVSGHLGQPSLFVSLEMGDIDIGERILGGQSGLGGKKLKHARELQEAEWTVLIKALDRLKGLPLAILDTPGLDLARLASAARRDILKRGTKLLVIDYLGLIDGTGDESSESKFNRQEVVSKLSRRCKQLARELDIPLVLLCQLNRENTKRPDKRPFVSDLRESGSIEQDADNVILLHRPDAYDVNDEPGIAYADVAKQRNGETDRVKLFYRKAHTRFENLDMQNQAPPIEDFGHPNNPAF